MNPKLVVILDIDLTLLEATEKSDQYDQIINFRFRGKPHELFISIRPGAPNFLDRLTSRGDVVVLLYTAGTPEYLEALILQVPLFTNIKYRYSSERDRYGNPIKKSLSMVRQLLNENNVEVDNLQDQFIVFDDNKTDWEANDGYLNVDNNLVLVKPYRGFVTFKPGGGHVAHCYKNTHKIKYDSSVYNSEDEYLFNKYWEIVTGILESNMKVGDYLKQKKTIFSQNMNICVRGLTALPHVHLISEAEMRKRGWDNDKKTLRVAEEREFIQKFPLWMLFLASTCGATAPIENKLKTSTIMLTNNEVNDLNPSQEKQHLAGSLEAEEQYEIIHSSWLLNSVYALEVQPKEEYYLSGIKAGILLDKDEFPHKNLLAKKKAKEEQILAEESRERMEISIREAGDFMKNPPGMYHLARLERLRHLTKMRR